MGKTVTSPDCAKQRGKLQKIKYKYWHTDEELKKLDGYITFFGTIYDDCLTDPAYKTTLSDDDKKKWDAAVKFIEEFTG